MDGLNKRHLFLTVLEAGKSKIKVPEYSILGDGPLLPSSLADYCHLTVCSQDLFFVLIWREGERERDTVGSHISSSSYKDTNPIMKVGSSSLSKPNYILKAPSPNTITLGVRASTYEFFLVVGIQTFSPQQHGNYLIFAC